MSPTQIEWTDETLNIVTGCDRVSPGCDACYIERTIPFRTEGRRFDEQGRMGVRLHPDRIEKPLRWRRPRRVFMPSLGDLFHRDVPDDFVLDVLVMVALAHEHTFQVLTKRERRLPEVLDRLSDRLFPAIETRVEREENPRLKAQLHRRAYRHSFYRAEWPLRNLWLGVSVESQRYADIRIPHLLATPAAVRFLSIEPLLGPVDLSSWLAVGRSLRLVGDAGLVPPDARIGWVIVGGESGPRARPMHPEWARSIRDQCVAAGVPFLYKQHGEWVPTGVVTSVDYGGQGDIVYAADGSKWPDGELAGCARWWPWEGEGGAREHVWPDGSTAVRVGKKTAGRLLDGQTWDEYPDA